MRRRKWPVATKMRTNPAESHPRKQARGEKEKA